MQQNPAIFAVLLITSLAFFAVSCYRRLSLVALGAPENRFDSPVSRFRFMLTYAFGQKRVLERPSGLNHLIIFWSFLVLLIANAEFIAAGLFPTLGLHQLPAPLRYGLLLLFDAASLLTLFSVAFALGRRLLFKPDYLDSRYVKGRSVEGLAILVTIALLVSAYLLLNAVLVALGTVEVPAAWLPVSHRLATLFEGLPESALLFRRDFFWWLHALLLLGFLCYLPHSKHLHVLFALPNCFFRGDGSGVPPRETFGPEGRYGAGKITDFTWKDLFDSFSCTECGRCQDSCPAAATGKPLNPRQVVHAIKANLLANAPLLAAGKSPEIPLIGPEREETSTEETIWSCTTCGACLKSCPVMIEQMPKIVKMRRYLVQMEARFPEELLNLFENVENRSNPWGIPPAERTKWQGNREVKPYRAGETEWLLYVGCAGSFNSRQKQVTQAVATLLDAAGVSWGTLGKEEKCCGDSLRRLGNEYLFDRTAEENVLFFKEKGVTRVVTTCPHCFSTLKNDYWQYGLEVEVVHHAELIDGLLKDGSLKLQRWTTEAGNILYHDPCYLGRHNGIYASPRDALAKATGIAPEEFPRKEANSFCCGAGGGRMWLEEHTGERINLARVDEALGIGSDTVCVACPYCMTMFEDGLKDRGAEIRVRDLAEIVVEGL